MHGSADWLTIGKARKAMKMPVVENSGISSSGQAAKTMRQSGSGGIVMRGWPWKPALMAHRLIEAARPKIRSGIQFTEMMKGHYDEIPGYNGRDCISAMRILPNARHIAARKAT